MKILDRFALPNLVVLALFLGFAPFFPPHILEKIGMFFNGNLVRSLDIFDLVFHVAPWVLLALKLVRVAQLRRIS